MKAEKTKFQELMGSKPEIKILEALLEGGKVDTSMRTIKEEVKVSNARLYEIVKDLVKRGIVIKTRKIKNKQKYCLNYKNPLVKELDRFFVRVITR